MEFSITPVLKEPLTALLFSEHGKQVSSGYPEFSNRVLSGQSFNEKA